MGTKKPTMKASHITPKDYQHAVELLLTDCQNDVDLTQILNINPNRKYNSIWFNRDNNVSPLCKICVFYRHDDKNYYSDVQFSCERNMLEALNMDESLQKWIFERIDAKLDHWIKRNLGRTILPLID